ncbi:cytochrome P450 alkane hydroxylase [Corynespora cassiicola Philippines]|uniref:Cytochrome P450 alkane hydroxylase n=1 Tax=Corynespora cassiicola Philippines TaxID=1448308 RepID=A0A2T2N029_CORCC|nr:cytochrome P450 alkane hydroxylase [Corynespora cassiicola Philippines]
MNQVLLALAVAILLIWNLTKYISRYRQNAADQKIGQKNGCLPAPRLPNQRPLGVDRLEQMFRADAESRLMELFLFHFRQTGSTLEQEFLGTKAYGTIEPANVETILSTKFQDYGTGPRRAIMLPLFGDGIFTQEGSDWKHSRDMLRLQLQHKQYANLDVFRTAADDLVQLLQRNNGIVDLQPLFFRLTLDTITEFLFGESVHSLNAPKTAGEPIFATAFNAAQKCIAKQLRLRDLYWLVNDSRFRQACRDVHDFADRIIDGNLSPNRPEGEEPGRYLFLDSIARKTMDRLALRGQIINLLAAGRDTTASLLSWTLFLLVRHPHTMEKLRAEIALVCNANSGPNRKELKRMQYLQNVLKETLRLYPPVPVNIRAAIRTTVLPTGGGPDQNSPVLIPKGSIVAFSVYSMHRRPDLYGMDAELFRPERWNEDMPLQHDPTSSKWGYLPFHGGPRICLGMDFALTEAGYTIVRLLQTFKTIKLPEGEKTQLVGVEGQTMTLTMSIKEGCSVEVR